MHPFLPVGLVGCTHYPNVKRERIQSPQHTPSIIPPGVSTVNPNIPVYPVITPNKNDLGAHYRPMRAKYTRTLYGGPAHIPKHVVFMYEPPIQMLPAILSIAENPP